MSPPIYMYKGFVSTGVDPHVGDSSFQGLHWAFNVENIEPDLNG